MKRVLIILGILSILSICAVQLKELAQAITVGTEPPAQYINNLKTCTKGTFRSGNGEISEYTIKGALPSGRCEVEIRSYTDFSDPKVYENYKRLSGAVINSFSKENPDEIEFPTQQQMMAQAIKEMNITKCKFNTSERAQLYRAYLKHDNQNPPAKVTENQIKVSFSSEKMSSYDKLMMNMGSCISYDNDDPQGQKILAKYACEYADATCYYTKLGEGGYEVKCSNEPSKGIGANLMKTVDKHVKAGMCEKIF